MARRALLALRAWAADRAAISPWFQGNIKMPRSVCFKLSFQVCKAVTESSDPGEHSGNCGLKYFR